MSARRMPFVLAALLFSTFDVEAAHTDFYGDVLPSAALARLGTMRLRHGGQPSMLAFSGDGKLLASATREYFIHIWDPATGAELARIATGRGRVTCLAFSRDSRFLAFGTLYSTVAIWDLRTGKKVSELFPIIGGEPTCVAFSPDGQRLAAARSVGSVVIWNLSKGNILRELPVAGLLVSSLAFSPDGKFLACGQLDDKIQLWELTGAKPARSFAALKYALQFLSFSPDGKWLVARGGCWDGSAGDGIKAWEVATGKVLVDIRDSGRVSVGATLAPDGSVLVVAASDPGPKARAYFTQYEMPSGKLLHDTRVDGMSACSLALATDGKRLAIGSRDHTIVFGELTKHGIKLPHSKSVSGHPGGVLSAVFLKNLVCSAGQDGTIRLWEAARGQEVRRLQAKGISAVAFAGNVQRVAWTGSGAVHVQELPTGRPICQFATAKDASPRLALSDDGNQLALESERGRILIFDASNGRLSTRLEPPGRSDLMYYALTFSPGAALLAAAGHDSVRHSDGTLCTWDVKTRKQLFKDSGHGADMKHTAFSDDAAILAALWSDRSIRLWDLATGQIGARFPPSPELDGPLTLAFAPDDRTLACGYDDGTIALWEVASHRVRQRFVGHAGEITSLGYSTDGRVLLSGSSDTTSLLWDVTGSVTLSNRKTRLDCLELKKLWEELHSTDAGRAYDAEWSLVAAPDDAVSFLADTMKSTTADDMQKLGTFVKNLDSSTFQTREHAMRALRSVGSEAKSALRETQTDKSSPEVRRRAAELLRQLDDTDTASMLCSLRGVEVLEHIGNSKAAELLISLAKGSPRAQLTQQATAALQRLARRGSSAGK